MELSFSKNGDDLGVAFRVSKESLNERALLPHVLCKNCVVELNFGQKEEPFFPPAEEFVFIHAVPVEDRVRTTLPPKTMEECEVGAEWAGPKQLAAPPPRVYICGGPGARCSLGPLCLWNAPLPEFHFPHYKLGTIVLQVLLMVGLPGSGKTQWALKYAQDNPEKRYNVLGAETVLNQMKVSRRALVLKALGQIPSPWWACPLEPVRKPGSFLLLGAMEQVRRAMEESKALFVCVSVR